MSNVLLCAYFLLVVQIVLHLLIVDNIIVLKMIAILLVY